MQTTKEDFKKFIQFCEDEIKAFGLTEWEVKFYHERLESSFAKNFIVPDAKAAYISLNTEWQTQPVFDQYLREVARHEVLDLLLLPVAMAIPHALGLSIGDNSLALNLRDAAIHAANHRISNRYHPASRVEFAMEDALDKSGAYRLAFGKRGKG